MIQLIWLMLLAIHTGGATVWWWMMPGGFPSSSTEYWVNGVAPLAAVVLFLTALFARGRLSETVMPPVLAAIPLFWMAFGISARITFDDSFRSSWNLPFLVGAGVAGLWARQFRFRVRARWLLVVLMVAATLAGWTMPHTLRAAPPATSPSGAPFANAPDGRGGDRKVIKLSKDAQVRPDDGRVVVRRDALVLNVQPMLSFANRSPDACWTALAPPELNKPTVRALLAKVHDGAAWNLHYRDEDQSVLNVATRDGAVLLDARSRLARPVYSHGNSLAELTISGHKKLAIGFSPVPQQRVEVAAPGAAARFAYVDEGGTFHVMQASQQQRGPFTELASGKLGRTEPLVVTIYDGDKAAFTVTLDDWAAQASTQLSPTAGWGVPANAIEMARGGEAETAPVLISFSLAATNLGRGTASVGHAAGVYRDRITVKLP